MEFTRPRGTRDFLFEEMEERKKAESTLRYIFENYGYREIKTPLFEELKLFTTKSGEEIVDQLYNFKDKSDRQLTLRPEITAPVARLYLNELKGLEETIEMKIKNEFGLSSFVILATCATFVHGWWLLGIFVLWQISGAFMEPVHDLLFFDNTQKNEQSRFYGIFRTTAFLPNVIAPILGALCIAITGNTSSVWFVSVAIGVFTLFVLLSRK